MHCPSDLHAVCTPCASWFHKTRQGILCLSMMRADNLKPVIDIESLSWRHHHQLGYASTKLCLFPKKHVLLLWCSLCT